MHFILAILAVAFSAGLFGEFPADSAATDDWTRGTPPCATEDSAGPCHWDDGTGARFVVLPAGDPADNDDDLIIYVNR